MKASRIDGWMGMQPLRWLRTMGHNARTMAEVGVWKGRATKALASNTRGTLYAIDTWAGVPDDPKQAEYYGDQGEDAYREFLANLAPEIELGTVIPMRSSSTDAAATFEPETFDLVFVDADHRYEAVRDDLEAWWPLVRRGGVLAGHDYHWPGVAKAVHERFGAPKRGPGSIWWVLK
jgi:SAM-dependent methyltransferase